MDMGFFKQVVDIYFSELNTVIITPNWNPKKEVVFEEDKQPVKIFLLTTASNFPKHPFQLNSSTLHEH